jgi:Flp pilus assembly protein TadD
MNVRIRHSVSLVGLTLCLFSLSACHSREDQARKAFDQYQAANASGDLIAARTALLALVSADDTVADYWVELGKVQIQLGDMGGAYSAYQRAHELDRANPTILGIQTQLALRAGNLTLAQQSARDLELVAPDDPAVGMTFGYVALRQGELAEADRRAKLILAANPNDPNATVLHARVLLASGEPDKAAAVLREQVRLQPSDQQSLRALLAIYELRDDWPGAATVARGLVTWKPKDQAVRARLIGSALRAGNSQMALAETTIGLRDANPREINLLLAPWFITGQQRQVVATLVDAARQAQGERRTTMARQLALAGQPKQVLQIVRDLATQPVKPANIVANALYGEALAATNQVSQGLERLNAVLRVDPANTDALRGRASLRSRTGEHKLAIEDAQKLVAADRGSAEARLFLARTYTTAGQDDDARRTLWDAFHDIPAERSIFEALRPFVLRSGDPRAAQLLSEEFNDQRNEAMIRSFA